MAGKVNFLIKKFMEEFKAFALRGNVMDMAVGVIIGGAFSGIVTSLTDNFIKPILNVLTGDAEGVSGRTSECDPGGEETVYSSKHFSVQAGQD